MRCRCHVTDGDRPIRAPRMRDTVLYDQHDAAQIVDIAKRVVSQHHEVGDAAFGEKASSVLFADRAGTDDCR